MRNLCAALVAVLPLVSAAGNLDYSTAAPSPDSTQNNAPPVGSLVERLEQRLAADGEDFSGWLLLMQSYLHLDAPAQADRALQRAMALADDSADELVRLAKAIEGSSALLEVSFDEVIRKALALDPGHPEASRLAAERATQGGRPTISYVSSLLGELATPPERSDSGTSPEIQVHVSLSETLRSEVSPTDVVFVYVRSVSKPIPLAVIRRRVEDLPFDAVFDESNAMIKGHSLTREQSDLEIVARVSRSGDTIAQKGDLQGTYSGVSAAHVGVIEVVVDTQLN